MLWVAGYESKTPFPDISAHQCPVKRENDCLLRTSIRVHRCVMSDLTVLRVQCSAHIHTYIAQSCSSPLKSCSELFHCYECVSSPILEPRSVTRVGNSRLQSSTSRAQVECSTEFPSALAQPFDWLTDGWLWANLCPNFYILFRITFLCGDGCAESCESNWCNKHHTFGSSFCAEAEPVANRVIPNWFALNSFSLWLHCTLALPEHSQSEASVYFSACIACIACYCTGVGGDYASQDMASARTALHSFRRHSSPQCYCPLNANVNNNYYVIRENAKHWAQGMHNPNPAPERRVREHWDMDCERA